MKYIFTVVLALMSFTLSAQFDVTSGTKTDRAVKVDTTLHQIWETKKGTPYIIIKSSRTNNYYPVWIGMETDSLYQGKQVIRQSKSGRYFILAISQKTKQPYCKWIK